MSRISIQALIDAYIKRNAKQEITGPRLNAVLTAIEDDTYQLAEGKQGLLTPEQLEAVNSGITRSSVLKLEVLPETEELDDRFDELQSQIDDNATDIAAVVDVIPAAASKDNKLADKSFVNSSIATNTAYFIGVFESEDELFSYPTQSLTNNDYANVKRVDALGLQYIDRWKWNGDQRQWKFEFTINNTTFTFEQLLAINSGITAVGVDRIAENANNIATLGSKVDSLAVLTVPYDDIITQSGASLLVVAKKYSVINVLDENGYIGATILPSTNTTTGWMYEYQEGWRMCKVDEFVLGDDTTWVDLCDFLDSHSARVVADAPIDGNVYARSNQSWVKAIPTSAKQSAITIEWEDGTSTTGCLVNE